MLTYRATCPSCKTEQTLEPEESQIYAEALSDLKASPYRVPDHPGADDHELFGYCLSHCPNCGTSLIVHFNVVLHRYLALIESHFPADFAAETPVEAKALFEKLDGDLSFVAIDPVLDIIEL
jgi:hypothetical protein